MTQEEFLKDCTAALRAYEKYPPPQSEVEWVQSLMANIVQQMYEHGRGRASYVYARCLMVAGCILQRELEKLYLAIREQQAQRPPTGDFSN